MNFSEWTADSDDVGLRVDVVISQQFGCSRTEAHRLLDQGDALVNGKTVKPGYRIRPGDHFEVNRPEPVPTDITPEAIPLNIVFEDEMLLVIDKPVGMVVHPAPGSRSGTLVNAILAHSDDLSGIGGEHRPGIVHRLDKDTSGLLVVAKCDLAHIDLQRQIQLRTAERVYRTVVWGVPKARHTHVDAPIGRHPVDRKRMAVIADSKHPARDATTDLAVEESFGEFALLEAKLKTGRTHQIRVHASYLGHPVVGDKLYGGAKALKPDSALKGHAKAVVEDAIANLEGQALHAFRLSFDHPVSCERLVFESPIRPDMVRLLEALQTAFTPHG